MRWEQGRAEIDRMRVCRRKRGRTLLPLTVCSVVRRYAQPEAGSTVFTMTQFFSPLGRL